MAVVSFEAGLVRKPEVHTSKDGRKYAYLSVAESFQKYEDGNYIDNGTFYKTVLVSNSMAAMLEESDLAPGTRLLIQGETYPNLRQSYTTKDGQVVPERLEESIRATKIAVSLNGRQAVKVVKGSGSTTSKQQPSQVQPQSQPVNQPTVDDDIADKFKDFFGD